MNAFLSSAEGAGLVGLVLMPLALILGILWFFMPWWLLRRLDALEKQAKEANARMDTLILHVATLNSNLVAYGQSMERRLDAAAGKEKTPGQQGHGVRYEIGTE